LHCRSEEPIVNFALVRAKAAQEVGKDCLSRGVIRTENRQRRGRTLAVISFVLIGLWAIVGTVVGVMTGLWVTSITDQTAASAPSGLISPRLDGAGRPFDGPGRSAARAMRKAKSVAV
jgi:hypothetical protein